MKNQLQQSSNKQILIITKKFDNLTKKYDADQDISVKDLEDMRRYSEILKNLSQYLESLYRW